ncbi:hypothetical protein BY458DRAFT_495882 [Sporodiniella umbellata]|nr:hypothetical protein BY458DRAFT_495882 [Sporodiniella umbellata]
MPTFTSTISRMKSVKLSFKKVPQEDSIEDDESAEYEPIVTTKSVLPLSNKSFSEALVVISQETQNTQFDDVFDSFFFNDKRCQHRALFMAARLKQSLPTKSPDHFWRLVTHRLYTLNYILFVLPSDSISRRQFLDKFETHSPGGMEADFAVRYTLEHQHLKRRKTLLEDAFELEKRKGGTGAGLPDPAIEQNKTVQQATVILQQCLESESRLGHAEKDAMYVFHSLRAGLLDTFVPHIELEEDRSLRHRLKRSVDENRKPAYQNPFEDEDCIVTEEDDSLDVKREVDSGFYDGWIPNKV